MFQKRKFCVGLALIFWFTPENSFPDSWSDPEFDQFPRGLRWIGRNLRFCTGTVLTLNRDEKSLQSTASTSGYRPGYYGQTQDLHKRSGVGIPRGNIVRPRKFSWVSKLPVSEGTGSFFVGRSDFVFLPVVTFLLFLLFLFFAFFAGWDDFSFFLFCFFASCDVNECDERECNERECD